MQTIQCIASLRKKAMHPFWQPCSSTCNLRRTSMNRHVFGLTQLQMTEDLRKAESRRYPTSRATFFWIIDRSDGEILYGLECSGAAFPVLIKFFTCEVRPRDGNSKSNAVACFWSVATKRFVLASVKAEPVIGLYLAFEGSSETMGKTELFLLFEHSSSVAAHTDSIGAKYILQGRTCLEVMRFTVKPRYNGHWHNEIRNTTD